MNESEMVHYSVTDLVQQSELYEPMLYYGSSPRIAIEYVSDIHLIHHVYYYDNDIRKAVRTVAKSLYESSSAGIQVFLGDVSSDRNVTVAFYRQYRLNVIYKQYKRFKCALMSEDDILALEGRYLEAKTRRNRLEMFITKKRNEIGILKSEINEYISYNKVIAPKGSLDGIKKYLESTYYKKRMLPHYVTEKILAAASLKNEILQLEKSKQRLDDKINNFEGVIQRYEENSAEGLNEPVTLLDFKYEDATPFGLVILGNHEYIGFRDVDEAVEFYRRALEPLGYTVLHNSFLEYKKFVIYGGSGFAKYNRQFNANNIVCCDAMMGNREYEITQTTLFENGYERAKRYAKEAGKCFICVAHYPVESCLGKFDREAIYFTGHTHKNERVRTEDKVLYADNQVGYHNDGGFDGVIRFKCAKTDSVINPYLDFKDGYYQTTPDAYLQFCDYIGEYIGEGLLIRKRCETGTLYVIKLQGYYGFFLINKSGISIVNGGQTKKLAVSCNIEWIYNNFSIVVRKYLEALEPLRATQVQISNELKRLGFDGRIHGLVVDIDFYNHIMVNPVDGTIVFYYSPTYGQIRPFESFQKQLTFMGRAGLLESKVTESQCNKIALYGSNILLSNEDNYSLSEMRTVSRGTGAYGVSRAISPLQRLFTGHWLRDFDLTLVEVEDKSAARRITSYRGRMYRDSDYNEYLVIQDDLREFLRLLDVHGNESVISVQKLRSSIARKSWNAASWMTKSIEETVSRYGKMLPEAWQSAIQQMSPKLITNGK